MDYRNPIHLFTLALAVCFLALFVVLIWKIYTNVIDLSDLLSEPGLGGKASLSRFQLLVFTLVISGLYVILSIENGQLIDVPDGALLLLGISGGTYAIAKGIGKNPPTRETTETTVVQTSTAAPVAPAAPAAPVAATVVTQPAQPPATPPSNTPPPGG